MPGNTTDSPVTEHCYSIGQEVRVKKGAFRKCSFRGRIIYIKDGFVIVKKNGKNAGWKYMIHKNQIEAV